LNISYDDLLAQASCCSAGADAGSDLDTINRLNVGIRKAGRGAMAKMRALLIEQKDRAQHVIGLRLDKFDETPQNHAQRCTSRNLFKDAVLTGNEGFAAVASEFFFRHAASLRSF
jgi:hypothetical protein